MLTGLEKYYGCPTCLDLQKCEKCMKYQIKEDIENNNYCLECNNKSRCACNRIVDAIILMNFGGVCNECKGFLVCGTCNQFFPSDIIIKYQGFCQNDSPFEYCLKCYEGYPKRKKTLNGLCKKCNPRSCDVCFLPSREVIKRCCNHYECKDCKIPDGISCAKCLNLYKCKSHPSHISHVE